MERNRNSIVKRPKVKPTTLFVRRTVDTRALAEIDRKRNQVYLSHMRNQIR